MESRGRISPGTRFRVVLVVLIALVAIAVPGPAWPASGSLSSPIAFDPLAVEQGLSSSFVTHLLQDSAGFIWISTTDGLNRYDGYAVQVFRYDPLDSTSLAGNYTQWTFEDAAEDLWIGLGIGGLDRWDRETGRFTHYRAVESDPGALPSDAIGSIAEDSAGNLWIGTAEGLVRVDRADLGNGDDSITFRRQPIGDGPGHLPRAQVRALCPDRNGSVWAGTDSGLAVITPGGEVTRMPVGSDDPAQLGVPITCIVEDSRHRLWVGTARSGLCLLDRSTGRWTRYVCHPDDPRSLSSNTIRAIHEDPSGDLWLITGPRGIDRLDPESGACERLADRSAYPLPQQILTVGGLHAGGGGHLVIGSNRGLALVDLGTGDFAGGQAWEAPRAIADLPITAVFTDRSGLLWIGTWGGGVHKLNERALRFGHVARAGTDPGAPALHAINCLHEDPGGRLWVGTQQGLQVVGPDGRTVTSYAGDGAAPRPPGSLGHSAIHCLYRDRRGTMWVGSANGLHRVRERAGAGREVLELERYRVGDGPPVMVNALLEDHTGRFWIGTSGGLVELDRDSGESTTYGAQVDDPRRLPSLLVSCLYEDRQGELWIGTYIGGLSRYRRATGDFEHFRFAAGDSGSLNSKSVSAILEDRTGRLWVGTYSGGLNLLDPVTRRFSHFTERDGLSGNKVNGILEDEQGYLWVSTNKGLTRFDPRTRAHMNYDHGDGLQSNEFLEGSCFKTESGELLFGGVDGYNRFLPASIPHNDAVPPIAITSFKRFDREVPLGSAGGGREEIELDHRDDFFSFEFAALDFTNPPKNQFAYMLEGFDPDWIHCGPRRYAAYTNLDPGRYTFRVKGSNNDGVWNQTGLAIDIRIRPPWWRTPIFYGLASIALIGGALGAHRLGVRRKVKQSTEIERIRYIERERVQEQVAADYHDELGTNLSKISLYTELARRKLDGNAGELTPLIDQIAASAEALARDARDFIWTLNPRQDTLYDIGVYLQDFGQGLFEGTGVRFTVDGLAGDLRRHALSANWKRHLILIFKEGMNNVLKHAACRELRLSFEQEAGELAIALADDGVGLAATKPHAGGGNGDGLGNMRRRAVKLGGRLDIQSEAGRGTTIRFRARLE